MLLFEFDSGHLYTARLGAARTESISPEVMRAVRDQALQIIGHPLFPVGWFGSDDPADPHRLVALDPSGQVASVEISTKLDSVTLVAALARSGRTAALGWIDLAEMYPGGPEVFRRDWAAFREALPPRPVPGARLYVLAGGIEDDVRPALETLADSGVEVFDVAQRESADGRVFVEVTEPFRLTVPTLSGPQLTAAGRMGEIGGAVESSIVVDAAEPPEFASDEDTSSQSPAEEAEAQAHAVEPPFGAPTEAETVPAPPTAAEPTEAVDRETPDVEPDSDLARLSADIGSDVPLVWAQLRRGIRHDATLRADGVIEFPDGRCFADPSAAAAAASGREVADGWHLWRITDGGPSLTEALAELSRPRPSGRRGA